MGGGQRPQEHRRPVPEQPGGGGGAKTGSAQVGSADKEAGAVFTLFAPYDDPEIVISIVVEGGASGGNLAQAAGEIVNYYFSAEHTVESVDAENTLLR